MKWIADIRSGCCAVYFAEKKHNCLSGITDESVFYRRGTYDTANSVWNLPKRHEVTAKVIAAIYNFFKIER